MTWLKAQFGDEAAWSALLEQVVADSRRLPSGSGSLPHVYADPERRELYCDAVALATLNALIALDHLDEVPSMPPSGVIAVVPEAPPGDATTPAAASRRPDRGDGKAAARRLLPVFGAQPA
ncbi:MAG TPA: hypothetical protein VMR06_02360 [Dokdonella sp.]|uniref:hypothetical protein n=1 Tax=Dokdonella sp. TaxID=2291710 RepID=UPI002BC96AF4|nr:hypothetical protein [Dokdonella sp.]HUD40819.1 hypothetical protein [Dokdonella sp.]